MQDVVIHIKHPDMERISDRSARQVLKTLSASVRQAQAEDLRNFIFSLDLPYSRLQSMADLMDGPIQRTPAYDLEELRKGSLILTAVVSVAIVGVFVREVVEVALDDEEERRKVLVALRRHMKKVWPQSLLDKVIADLKERGLGARMIMKTWKIRQQDKEAIARIIAETEADEDGHPIPRERLDTTEKLEAHLKTRIRAAKAARRVK